MTGDDTERGQPFDGRYRVLGRLGVGGMATVYLAEDSSLGRKVALKVMAERYAEDGEFVERFRREAQAAARLNHPNIIAVYDRGEADGRPYIAMEYLQGRTLKQVIQKEGPLPPSARSRSRCRCSRACATRTSTASCTATSSRTTCSSATTAASR